jgi:hypothetical protein
LVEGTEYPLTPQVGKEEPFHNIYNLSTTVMND